MNITEFASRFSFEDWSSLCTNDAFLKALKAEEFGQAEVIAHGVLTAPQLMDKAFVDAVLEYERQHALATKLVADWAKATNHTGSAHKQARQSRIRKLIKNGIKSEYARAIMAEAKKGSNE